MSLSVIVAVSQNGIIGQAGGLPWHLSADLKRFKALTMGHYIIMGRRTYESLGRCLPGRTNVIVSETGFQAPPAITVSSLQEALRLAANDAEPFVIGGARLFDAAQPIARRLYLTRILRDVPGDTHLDLTKWDLDNPEIWRQIECSSPQVSADGQFVFQFETWARSDANRPYA